MRIIGITLPNEKRIEIALTAIFGIGRFGHIQFSKKRLLNLVKKRASSLLTKKIKSEALLNAADSR